MWTRKKKCGMAANGFLNQKTNPQLALFENFLADGGCVVKNWRFWVCENKSLLYTFFKVLNSGIFIFQNKKRSFDQKSRIAIQAILDDLRLAEDHETY